MNEISSTKQPGIYPEITADWFSKSLTCTVVRLQARVSPQDIRLANGKIIVKGHPTFNTNIGISGATPHTRGMERETITEVFSGQGFPMIDLSGSRGAAAQAGTVLELTDIHNSEGLRKEPLVIVLDIPLTEDEFLLPITFDGDHFLPVGEFCKEENGSPAIRIRDLEITTDPHVKYTILAGDITDYKVDKQGYFSALIEKIKLTVGKLAYGDLPNDIAVSVASIKKVTEKRQPKPETIDLICHHLNYFSEKTSLNALQMALF